MLQGPEARERLGSQSVFYGTKQGQTAQHEGFLYKKGDVRKKWKYWWCVLDIEHQEVSQRIYICLRTLFLARTEFVVVTACRRVDSGRAGG